MIFINTEDIYQKYGTMVYRYLLGMCQNEDLAEELTQETFYQAVKSSNTYDGSCKVSTWLCQIGKHMWYRELRRRKRFCDTEPEEPVSYAGNPEEQYLHKEKLSEVVEQIQNLSKEEKEVIMLRASTSLTFREIGEITGRSENWARVTYFRAKQKLKS